MKRFRKHKTIKIKKLNKYIFIIFIIFFISFMIYLYYINSMTDKIEIILNKKMTNINNNLVNNIIGIKSLEYIDINDLIIINKNKNDEILYVDFNLKNSYKMLRKITNEFEIKLSKKDLSFLKVKDKNLKSIGNMIYLDLPIGSIFSNYFTSSLGPKIPIVINLASSLASSLNVDIKNYGINNCIIKLYLNFDIYEDIYIPAKDKQIVKKVKVLVGSKVIEGKIPDIYGGTLSKDTSILSSET